MTETDAYTESINRRLPGAAERHRLAVLRIWQRVISDANDQLEFKGYGRIESRCRIALQTIDLIDAQLTRTGNERPSHVETTETLAEIDSTVNHIQEDHPGEEQLALHDAWLSPALEPLKLELDAAFEALQALRPRGHG